MSTRIKWKFLLLLWFVCGLPLGTAVAADTREIRWEDLIPAADFEDPFAALTQDQLYDLVAVYRTRQLLESGSLKTDELVQRLDVLEQNLDEQGIDVDALLARREEVTAKRIAQSKAVVKELDGKTVRMPGYMLPLEFDGEKVTEFFLVPYVGACIHTPPPPPNQMVLVSTGSGIESDELYEPVWVKGKITTESTTSEFASFDGTLDISAGYSMQAIEIEPYEY